MPRSVKIALVVLAVFVIGGIIYVRSLHQSVRKLSETAASEEQERREVLAPPITTPTDVTVRAKLFWISATEPDRLAPVTVPLPLSADPVERAKQLMQALIANPPTPAQRTLPSGTTLLDFYILSDGTAVADFSDALSTETPSGILSEWLTVDSIVRTLESNLAGVTRLKILIHGQEVPTLAGHVDLTGFFELQPPASTPPETGAPVAKPLPPSGAAAPEKPKTRAAAPHRMG